MARYNTFVATLSIFESLILKQIDLCSKTIITHFIIIVPLKCGILQGPHPSANISPAYQNEKKRMYASRVMEVEQATFTPLVFTTTGGMAPECQVYHKRLAEPLSKSQNLICLSENIPPVLKAIAFNKESKSQLKEMDFDIERGLFFLTDVKVQISF